MNKFWKWVWINISIIYGLSLMAVPGFGWVALLIAPVLIAPCEFVLAILLLISPSSRETGRIMLAASGLVLLIGLAVCSGGYVFSG